MNEFDISIDEIERIADALGANKVRRDKPKSPPPKVFFSVFTYKPIDHGKVLDDWYRIMRHENSKAFVHRELNSMMLVKMEIKKLRDGGFEVHLINTPKEMTVETREAQHAEFMEQLQQGKTPWDIWNEARSKAQK
ncbi:hypothetical protein A6U97_02520 [Agrobacterium tumefaciens]|uniref:hypothetical protein n=1 Tax=Agrobacterium tumefaciens TaxID=358 RepID=UPI0008101237|nr:hypothetical protein A6U97_02520 [Agrobacterium tumefaciens]